MRAAHKRGFLRSATRGSTVEARWAEILHTAS